MTGEITQSQQMAGEAQLGYRGRQALQAARQGLFVFPLYPGSKVPAVENWEQEATRDPQKIIEHWRHRPYNLGVATGPSGLVVVDLDKDKGATRPERFADCRNGRDVLALLAREAGAPAPWRTYTVATPGGQHLYFRAPRGAEFRNTAGTLGPMVDTRAHGGYVVGATSSREEGDYRATNRQPIAILPPWLVTALTPAAPEPVTAPIRTTTPKGRPDAYLAKIVDDELAELAAAQPGGRHYARLKAARQLGQLVGGQALSYAQARDELVAVASRHVGVAETPDGGTQRTTAAEVLRDIDDGLEFGMRLPRDISCRSRRPRR